MSPFEGATNQRKPLPFYVLTAYLPACAQCQGTYHQPHFRSRPNSGGFNSLVPRTEPHKHCEMGHWINECCFKFSLKISTKNMASVQTEVQTFGGIGGQKHHTKREANYWSVCVWLVLVWSYEWSWNKSLSRSSLALLWVDFWSIALCPDMPQKESRRNAILMPIDWSVYLLVSRSAMAFGRWNMYVCRCLNLFQ